MSQTWPVPWRSSWACKHTTKLGGESGNEEGTVCWEPRVMGSVHRTQRAFEACLIWILKVVRQLSGVERKNHGKAQPGKRREETEHSCGIEIQCRCGWNSEFSVGYEKDQT